MSNHVGLEEWAMFIGFMGIAVIPMYVSDKLNEWRNRK